MLDVTHWTSRNIRQTVCTWLSRLECHNVIAEAILEHSRKGIE